MIGDLQANQTEQHIDVFVQTREIIIVTKSNMLFATLPSPVIPAYGTSSSTVRQCLEIVPQSKELQDVGEYFMRRAQFGAEIDGMDGAYPNRRYDAYKDRSSAAGGPLSRSSVVWKPYCAYH